MATGERVSRREAEVLALVGEHFTNAEIATRLYISERTVESHVSALLRKLGAADRRDLARHHVASGADRGPPPLPPALELLADATSFVGRNSQREALRDRWRLAVAGRTMVVFVTAEAGMGKSRLVAEFAVDVHAGGGRVLYGACHEDADEPYGPFAQAIGDDAALVEPAEVARRVAEAADVLAELSPELARLVGHSAAPNTTGADVGERSTVLDAIRRWLLATARSAPLLMVIEDLHWSTSTTRDTLRHLVRAAGREPLLVVATTRDKRPDVDADLAALLAELDRSPSVARVPLPVGSSRVDLQACKLEYSIVSPK